MRLVILEFSFAPGFFLILIYISIDSFETGMQPFLKVASNSYGKGRGVVGKICKKIINK